MAAHRPLLAALTIAAVSVAWLGSGALQADDAELAAGILQAQQGEFEAAVLTLDKAVQRLTAARAPGQDLARAYVYLGVAQLGLGQEGKAGQSFVQARTHDPGLRLDAAEFPPRIVQAYEKAVQSMPAALATPKPAAPVVDAPPKKGGGSKALLVIGGIAAAGAGVAVAAGGGGTDSQPPPAATPTPPGLPDVSGRWVGDGSAGEFLMTGTCSAHNSVILTITQQGADIAGTADFVVLSNTCDPSIAGVRVNLTLVGFVSATGAEQVRLHFTNGPFPNEVWTGTVAGTRMGGPVTGIPGTTGNWSVSR